MIMIDRPSESSEHWTLYPNCQSIINYIYNVAVLCAVQCSVVLSLSNLHFNAKEENMLSQAVPQLSIIIAVSG